MRALLGLSAFVVAVVAQCAFAQSLNFTVHDNFNSFMVSFNRSAASGQLVRYSHGITSFPQTEANMRATLAAQLQTVVPFESQVEKPSINCPGKTSTQGNPFHEVSYVEYHAPIKFYVKATEWWMDAGRCMQRVTDLSADIG